MKEIWTIEQEAKELAARFVGVNQAAFARDNKISGGASMLSQFIKGRRPLNLDAATAISRGLGVPLEQISPRLAESAKNALFATEANHLESMMNKYGANLAARKEQKGGFLAIPQYNSGGSMGNGRLLLEDQPGVIKSWEVNEQWARMNLPSYTSFANLSIVTGFGPSMTPLYNSGDPLIVDRGITSCDVDGVYFFRVGEHGYIKILQRIPTSNGLVYRAKSKNPDYDPFDITKEMDFHVLAKVLRVWRGESL